MPELPDLEAYCAALRPRVVGASFERLRLASPFLLRSVTPPIEELSGREVVAVERLGKRLVFVLARERFLVLHLMIAGRLRWERPGAKIPGRVGLAAFDFAPPTGPSQTPPLAVDGGTLLLTEAGSKRRASLHAVAGREGLAAHDRGGLEPLAMSREELAATLVRERHTLKRTLTDPRLFAGIGNAYSDEILHHAALSPFALSTGLEEGELDRLHAAIVAVLAGWRDRLVAEQADGFPAKVTAFRPGMAVHGRFGQPCPRCGTPVQRIVYADNEANYCPTCQTGGRLLADRALSQLLRQDWPRTLAELEERQAAARARIQG